MISVVRGNELTSGCPSFTISSSASGATPEYDALFPAAIPATAVPCPLVSTLGSSWNCSCMENVSRALSICSESNSTPIRNPAGGCREIPSGCKV